MQCKQRVRSSRASGHALVRCGQCLNCRIYRRDLLVGRILIENLAASSGCFWTMTLDDDALASFTQKNARNWIRAFLQRLRRHERRAGNSIPVRSFGVLEYGGFTGRPHFHFMLWNQQATFLEGSPYRKGLPLPKLNSPHWPHGHVTSQTITPGSARYIAKYVQKFNKEQQATDVTVFHARKPTLGLYGLHMHLLRQLHSPLKRQVQLPFITIDGREWMLDRPLYGWWQYYCLQYGLPIENVSPENARIMNALREQLMQSPESLELVKVARRRAVSREEVYRHASLAYEAKQVAILERAYRYGEARTSADAEQPNGNQSSAQLDTSGGEPDTPPATLPRPLPPPF